MAATDISRTVGTENADIKVGLGLTMESKANSTTKAEDNVVSGVASATAETDTTPAPHAEARRVCGSG